MSSPELSIVIPFLNEAESLAELHQRLTEELRALGRSYEILLVNDGSTDGSDEIVDGLAAADAHLGVIHFRRNFGKAAALDAGFKAARGDVIVSMDADLQDDPAELARMLALLDEGHDVVSGWKKVRHDPWHKTLPSKLFNAVVRKASGLTLHDFNCGFKAYRRDALEGIVLYGELHRFVPVLVAARGARVTELAVQHHARRFGSSKYGVKRLAKGFFDLLTVLLLTRYRARPLHLFGLAGMLMGGIGVAILLYLTVLWFLGFGPIGTRPLLFLGLLLVMVGVQTVTTGLLAELIVTRSGAGEQTHYVIRETRLPGARDAAPVAASAAPVSRIR